jgi:hypothetical protein
LNERARFTSQLNEPDSPGLNPKSALATPLDMLPPCPPVRGRLPRLPRRHATPPLRRVPGPVHNPNNPWCGAQVRLKSGELGISYIFSKWTLPNASNASVLLSTWIGLGGPFGTVASGTGEAFTKGWFVSAGFDLDNTGGVSSPPLRFIEYWYDAASTLPHGSNQPGGLMTPMAGSASSNFDTAYVLSSQQVSSHNTVASEVSYGDTVGVSIGLANADSSVWIIDMVNYTQNFSWPTYYLQPSPLSGPLPDNALEARWAVEPQPGGGPPGPLGAQLPYSWGKVLFDRCTCFAHQGLVPVPIGIKLTGNDKALQQFVDVSTSRLSGDTPANAEVRDPECVVCKDESYLSSAADLKQLAISPSTQTPGEVLPVSLTNWPPWPPIPRKFGGGIGF